MSDHQAVAALLGGKDSWNRWRELHPERFDLSYSNLSSAHLAEYNLNGVDLHGATLIRADLSYSDLGGALLYDANLWGVDFFKADLRNANLTSCNLVAASFRQTILTGADISKSHIYGVSVWDVNLDETRQEDLTILPPEGPNIQVGNLEVAQFIYLLLSNEKIRSVIDTITSKVVLILGHFSPERKVILDAIRTELRNDYLPVLFDFDKPSSRDLTETISTLAHMARFVIADITDARSIPQELMAIVPTLPSVPVQPLLLASQRKYGLFEHFERFPWVLKPLLYKNQEQLLRSLKVKVIRPAEVMANNIQKKLRLRQPQRGHSFVRVR